MEQRGGVEEPKNVKNREMEMKPLVESDPPRPILPENHVAVEPKLSVDGGVTSQPENSKKYKYIVSAVVAAMLIAVAGYFIATKVLSGQGRKRSF